MSEKLNSFFFLSGMIASLSLDSSAIQASWLDPTARNVVSISSSFEFLRPAKIGEELTLESEILRSTSMLTMADLRFKNADGEVVATGKHLMKFVDTAKANATVPNGMDYV